MAKFTVEYKEGEERGRMTVKAYDAEHALEVFYDTLEENGGSSGVVALRVKRVPKVIGGKK